MSAAMPASLTAAATSKWLGTAGCRADVVVIAGAVMGRPSGLLDVMRLEYAGRYEDRQDHKSGEVCSFLVLDVAVGGAGRLIELVVARCEHAPQQRADAAQNR